MLSYYYREKDVIRLDGLSRQGRLINWHLDPVALVESDWIDLV